MPPVYLVPPVWLLPDPTRLMWPAIKPARPTRPVRHRHPDLGWVPVPGNPPNGMQACLNCREWHTPAEYGVPDDWHMPWPCRRVCPDCKFWWSPR